MHRRVNVTVVVSVCVSVKSHLISEASVRPKYCHALSEQQRSNICGVFSETALWKAICTASHFPVENAHAHYRIYHMEVPRVLHFSAFIVYALFYLFTMKSYNHSIFQQ